LELKAGRLFLVPAQGIKSALVDGLLKLGANGLRLDAKGNLSLRQLRFIEKGSAVEATLLLPVLGLCEVGEEVSIVLLEVVDFAHLGGVVLLDFEDLRLLGVVEELLHRFLVNRHTRRLEL